MYICSAISQEIRNSIPACSPTRRKLQLHVDRTTVTSSFAAFGGSWGPDVLCLVAILKQSVCMGTASYLFFI